MSIRDHLNGAVEVLGYHLDASRLEAIGDKASQLALKDILTGHEGYLATGSVRLNKNTGRFSLTLEEQTPGSKVYTDITVTPTNYQENDLPEVVATRITKYADEDKPDEIAKYPPEAGYKPFALSSIMAVTRKVPRLQSPKVPQRQGALILYTGRKFFT